MPKLLIVDDETAILFSTRCLLEALGYQVVVTSDHRDVVSTVRRERPDLVLHDVRMPGLDIEDQVTRIRGDPAVGETPVVLFSASMELADISRDLRVAGFLEKPFTIQALTGVLSRALSSPAGAGSAPA